MMENDFEKLREIVCVASKEAPIKISPPRARLLDYFAGLEAYAPPPMPGSEHDTKQVPRELVMNNKDIGIWKEAYNRELIEVEHYNSVFLRKGFSSLKIGGSPSELLGVGTKGRDFLHLSEPRQRWETAMQIVVTARAATFSNLVTELRRIAREDIKCVREELS